MAYNNGFPVTYPQYYQSYTYQQQSQPSQQGIIWVSGEAGAKAYLVAPNTTVQLWDSETQCIYLKSADASGMPSMKVLDYTIRENANKGPSGASQPQAREISTYATKAEIDGILAQIEAIRADVDKMKEEKA